MSDIWNPVPDAALVHEGPIAKVLRTSDDLAVLLLAMPRFNTINLDFLDGFEAAMAAIDSEEGLKGIVLTSAHADFCVGADLNMILASGDVNQVHEMTLRFHQVHRRMENGLPIVCALPGSALGGGYELALACHHIVAVDSPKLQVGLPEVMLGLIPGGGGTQRLPRRIGIQPALEIITQGKIVRAPSALKKGLVDGLVSGRDSLYEAARAWIQDNPKAKQAWDGKRFRWPGVRPGSDDARNLFLAGSAMAYEKTAGAFPAVKQAITAVHEGSLVDIDTSLQIEARIFAGLVVSPEAKAMVRTLFFHKQAADKQVGLPRVEGHGFRKAVVLGAGMMGAGIGLLCARSGLEVVLKDIHQEGLDSGIAHVDKVIGKMRHLSDEDRAALRGKLTFTLEMAPCEGADLVIEAVVENKGVKHAVMRELEPHLAENAVWASNTSALPITDLAEASQAPERVVGMHFFSPVEKMPLLEVIAGAATSDETLGRALALGKAMKKTCILVNDGYGFYTTNVFSAYILEGAELVAEGQDPRLIEWGARAAGMVVGPLQVFDEVTLTLGKHALTQGAAYIGDWLLEMPGVKLIAGLVDEGRTGRSGGAGFYDYAGGKRKGIWAGLRDRVGNADKLSHEAIGERLLLAQVAAAGRCLDSGVLREARDADVGAILGLGFAPNTGGPLSYVDRVGAAEVVKKLEALQAEHGERFAPAQRFREMAASGARFYEA